MPIDLWPADLSSFLIVFCLRFDVLSSAWRLYIVSPTNIASFRSESDVFPDKMLFLLVGIINFLKGFGFVRRYKFLR